MGERGSGEGENGEKERESKKERERKRVKETLGGGRKGGGVGGGVAERQVRFLRFLTQFLLPFRDSSIDAHASWLRGYQGGGDSGKRAILGIAWRSTG